MKRLIAFLSALALCTSAAGCQKADKTSDNSSQAQVEEVKQPDEAEQASDEITSFKGENLYTPQSGIYLGGIQPLGENRYLVLTSDASNLYQSVTDGSFSSITAINPQLPDECNNNGRNYFEFASESDGTVYALVTNETHDGVDKADYSDEKLYDEAYNAARYQQIYLVHYDKDFRIISSSPLDSLTEFVNESEYNYISSMCPLMVWDENNLLISTSENELILIDKENGTETDRIDTSAIDFEYMRILPDRDGKLLCFFHTTETFEVCELDKENKKLGEPFHVFEEDPRNAILSGTGNYRFYIGMSKGLYGFTDGGEFRLVMDWLESGMNINGSHVQLACEDGSFIVSEYSESGESSLLRYTRKKADEIKKVQKISLGHFGDADEFTEEINEFNQNSDEYKVIPEKLTTPEQLKLDIISGNAPDIIIHNDFSLVQKLSSKGVFTDLYELMANDTEVNRDTVLPNVLKACESDNGTLPALPNYFNLSTYMIKSKHTDKKSLTSHELIELYKSLPEGSQFTDLANIKKHIFESLANGGENFVDYEKAECYFDSPEFIEILEFCNTFPEEEDMPDKFADPEAHSNYYNDKATWLRNDKALVGELAEFGYLYDYNYYKYGYFGEDVTLCGMPLSKESKPMINFYYSFSVSNTCENKEGAWEFVKICLKKEYKSNSDTVIQWHHFPVINASFDKMVEDSQKKQGINETFMGIYEIPPLTQEDCDMLKEYIKTADIVQNHYYNSEVSKICNEEVQAFFAGEQTSDETADYIQNRVSIMLSEQS